MSNTNRDNLRVKIEEYYDKHYEKHGSHWPLPPPGPDFELLNSLGLTTEDLRMNSKYWAKEPSWFRNMFVERPNRRKEKVALKNIKKLEDYDDWDAYELPLARRPKEYWL